MTPNIVRSFVKFFNENSVGPTVITPSRILVQNEQEPENEDEEMSDDSEEGTLTGEDLSVAIGKIAELQADLEEERQRADALEKENEEQRILLEELKESFERELLRVQERRKKDLNKFNQFKRFVALDPRFIHP